MRRDGGCAHNKNWTTWRTSKKQKKDRKTYFSIDDDDSSTVLYLALAAAMRAKTAVRRGVGVVPSGRDGSEVLGVEGMAALLHVTMPWCALEV